MNNETTGLALLLLVFLFACDPQSLGENARAVVDAYHQGAQQ